MRTAARAIVLKFADLLARLWRLVPVRLRETFITGLFVLESRGEASEGLRRLFALQDKLGWVISERAMAYEGGLHPKHRLTGYHDFFVTHIAAGSRVLDVGCGHGAVAASIASRVPGSVVVGIDRNRPRLEQARRMNALPNLSFVEGDATRDVPAGRWDTIVLSNVLEHIEDRVGLLRAVLARSGARRVLIRVPLFERDWTMPMRKEIGANYFSDPEHFIEPRVDELRSEVAAAGLHPRRDHHAVGRDLDGVRGDGVMSDAHDSRPPRDERRPPAVSVVVPCYNSHAFLAHTLGSIRSQTWRDFEIVVVDDGSTDPDTLRVLDALGDDVRLVRQPNGGLPAARNAGIAAAAGSFIVPLDSDDWLDPRALEAMVEALGAAPAAAFAFCDMAMEGELTGVLVKNFNLFEQLFFNQLPYCICFRKQSWQACGGYDETMRRGYEDWDFNIRLAQSGPGLRIPEPLFHYRITRGGMLMGTSNRVHVELWNAIRRKHAELYRVRALVRLWWQWRTAPSTYPLAIYFLWLAIAAAAPLRASTMLFTLLRKVSHSRRVGTQTRRDGAAIPE